MRAGLALIAALSLCVTPAVAQGKTKGTPPVAVDTVAVQTLEICEAFASGDVLAVEGAIAKGWDAYTQESESPYVQSFAASKELPGIGYGDMFVLLEDYPDSSFGYCRLDVPSPAGSNGQVAMQSIQHLERYEGEGIQNGDGSFVSLTGKDDHNRMLLAHWTTDSFVIQLSIIKPKAAPAE